jgi:hypothetical protein
MFKALEPMSHDLVGIQPDFVPRGHDCYFRVHMWTDGGRPTGMALVQFNTPQEASLARNKDKGLMGTRYVEIFPATRGDLDKFMARTGEQLAV